MSEDKFKVIYTGEIREGFEIESVANKFAQRFKMTPEKALTILQAEREITLNKQAEHVKAYKLKSAFEEIGMQVKLERILLLVSNEELEKQAEQNTKENQETDKKSETQETETQETEEDKYRAANEKISKASDSWTLDPLKQKEDEESQESESNEGENSKSSEQPKVVKKQDFNYTGLDNSPVIGAKASKKPLSTPTEIHDTPINKVDDEPDPDEKNNIMAPMKKWMKKMGSTASEMKSKIADKLRKKQD